MPWNAVYYPNWRVYRQQPPSSLKIAYITHIFYAFAKVEADGTVHLSDTWADDQMPVDGTNGCIRACTQLRSTKPDLKIILSIGGGGRSENFSIVGSDIARRRVFVNTITNLVESYGLDGVDVDWETPQTADEVIPYLQLLDNLRFALPAPRYTLTTALPAGIWALKNLPLDTIAELVDAVMFMCYDFTGPWTENSGHHAALRRVTDDWQEDSDTTCGSRAFQYLEQEGLPASKRVFGIPCYGRSFLGVSGPGQNYLGHGGEEGTYEVRDLPIEGSTEMTDTILGAAYCFRQCCLEFPYCEDECRRDAEWVTYDNATTVTAKAHWAKHKSLGLFYWTGTGDREEESKSLIVAGYRAVHDARR